MLQITLNGKRKSKMTNVIRKATNKFTKGLVMDFSPENTQNELLTNALNATLLTFNGNELSLQNDMGNARVETAYLPEGYIPVGTCEYGGIIYIVSYNPLEDKSQIGCFPSPERNISRDELGNQSEISLTNTSFVDDSGNIKSTTQTVILKNDKLNPGDKFIISSDQNIYGELLKDLQFKSDKDSEFSIVPNPIISLNVVSIEDSGKVVYLDSSVRKYEHTLSNESGLLTYKYQILGKGNSTDGQVAANDIDSYRNTLSSGYSVFKSKTSGKLAILAELIMIDSYSVTHSIVPKKDRYGNVLPGEFDVVIHTEVLPELTSENFLTCPKLQYYYLKESQGIVQRGDSDKEELIEGNSFRQEFLTSEVSRWLPNTTVANARLKDTAYFDFPFADTYHCKKMLNNDVVNQESFDGYIQTKFTEGKYHRVGKQQIGTVEKYKLFMDKYNLEFRFYQASGKSEEVTWYPDESEKNLYVFYKKEAREKYIDAKRDTAYQSKQLYEYKPEELELVKDSNISKDTLIEKFAYQKTETWRLANPEELAARKNLWYEEGGSYKELKGDFDETQTYYVKEITEAFISLGFIDASNTIGDIYYLGKNSTPTPVDTESEDYKNYWDFKTYPLDSEEHTWGYKKLFYYKQPEFVDVVVPKEDIDVILSKGEETLYYDNRYILLGYDEFSAVLSESWDSQLFAIAKKDTLLSNDIFVPNTTDNYIQYQEKPSGDYPKDDPLQLYTVDAFIPGNLEANDNYLKYNDVKLASIKLPNDAVSLSDNPFPFVYNYTLVPCMNYGKLDHLKVSNTINFANIYNFDKSGITTWKYRIDENQLRLTVGTEVYDATSTDFEVDGLILEFYDLWGFAGSLVIDGKASYSGLFTKLINLNSLKSLHNKRVVEDVSGQEFNGGYLHNINITKNRDDEKYYLNGREVVHNEETGWNYCDEKIEDEFPDDCGTLYSNILYGVKAYLRKKDNLGNYTYFPIHNSGEDDKKKLFVYTIPFLNEYYYTKDDFTELGPIALDFVLTYKLEDSSIKQVYEGNGYKNGYAYEEVVVADGEPPIPKDDCDYAVMSKYVNGNMADRTDFTATKLYEYIGDSKLYIELGLKEDYGQFGLKYDPIINQYYTCDLQIISEDPDGKSVFVQSKSNPELKQEEVVNHSILSECNLTLDTIDQGNGIRDYNFLEGYSGTPLSLTYKLIVGYTITVSDIKQTKIPATTVCALCHKRDDGTYNYEDFSLEPYEAETDTYYNSTAVFYNEGDIDTAITGLCKQLVSQNSDYRNRFVKIASIEYPTSDIKTPGKMNSGDVLKQLLPNIGKLTFCSPHLHTLNADYGVNIYNKSGATNAANLEQFLGGVIVKKRNADAEATRDVTGGTIPLRNTAKLNMCANTVNSVKYQNEFISTVPYKTHNITNKSEDYIYYFGKDGRNVHTTDQLGAYNEVNTVGFQGFTYDQLHTFNRKLLTTMQSIYAYNPDYDSLSIYKGNVDIIDNQPQFTSNIINCKSELSEDLHNINNFVGFGDITVSDYLESLHDFSQLPVKNSKGEVLKQVSFDANFRYCGTSEKPVIITPITYNIPYPEELDQELQVDRFDKIILKNGEGVNTIIIGEINKNALYGRVGDSLLQLDVRNYYIGEGGELYCGTTSLKTKYDINLTNEDIQQLSTSEGLVKTVKLDNDKEVTVTFTMSSYSGLQGYSDWSSGYFVQATGHSIYVVQPSGLQSGNDVISCKLQIGVQCDDLEVKCSAPTIQFTINNPTLLMPNFPEGIDMTQLDASTIKNNLCVNSGVVIQDGEQLTYQWQDSSAPYEFRCNELDDGTFEFYIWEYYNSRKVSMMELNVSQAAYVIYQCFPESLSVTLEQEIDQQVTSSIVHVNRTTNYGKITNSQYSVSSDYPNTTFKGTSITINDLVYEPNIEGHRLFLRNDLYVSNQTIRNKIYYREIGTSDTDNPPDNIPNEVLDTWIYEGNEHKNCIYLFTGPCFEPTNLNM